MKTLRLLPLVAAIALGCDDASTTQLATTGVDCALIGVTVSPPSVTMVVGDSTQLNASAPTCGGLPVPFAVFWRSSNAAVATVDSAGGKVHAVAAGQVTIIALVVADTAVKGAAVIAVNPR